MPKQLKLGESAPEPANHASAQIYGKKPLKNAPLPDRLWIPLPEIQALSLENRRTVEAYRTFDAGHHWFIQNCEAVRRALGGEK
jgi:hypothetical protein